MRAIRRTVLAVAVVLAVVLAAPAASLPSSPVAAARAEAVASQHTLHASANGRYLVRQDGTPFFYLGDTAWELFHRQNREDADTYLTDRAAKGFTVIQAVGLAELDGIGTPNAYGHLPLDNRNPATPRVVAGPANDYWDNVDHIVDRAASLGMHVGFLPTWGSYVNDSGKAIFTAANAYAYGQFLGARYRDDPIIWILGGDRPADTNARKEIWRQLARGIAVGVSGAEDHGQVTMTYHSWAETSSSAWFHDEPWLDFNAIQSGAKRWNNPCIYECVAADYARTPVKPTVDIEVNYDDSVVNWDPDQCCYTDYDVRKGSYWSVFAGGHGITYGTRNIWQFWTPDRPPVSYPQKYWYDSLDLPGAFHVALLKNLMLSRPFLTRVPAQGLLTSPAGSGGAHVRATKNADGAYAFVYVPNANQSVTVDMSQLTGGEAEAWWYNPRDGKVYTQDGRVTTGPFGRFPTSGTRRFTTPASGPDWVLVLDDATKDLPVPGTGTQQPPEPPVPPASLRNPGFEDGETGWTKSGSKPGWASTDGNANSGARSFNFWATTSFDSRVQQVVPDLPGGAYAVRVWSKAGGTFSTYAIEVRHGATLLSSTPITRDAGRFVATASAGFTVPDGADLTVRVQVNASASTWAYVDDVELVAGGA